MFIPDSEAIPLPQLTPRRCALVDAVTASREDAARLGKLGICIGRTIQIVRGGDPMILQVFGSRIGIAGRLAATIQVRPCVEESCHPPTATRP